MKIATIKVESKKQHELRVNALKELLEKYRDIPAGHPHKAIIDSGIEIYKNQCKNSLDEGRMRRFETLMLRYVLPDPEGFKATKKEISFNQNVSFATVRRDVKAAIKDLMIIFFGVDGVLFEDK